jgi:hypothetical protein
MEPLDFAESRKKIDATPELNAGTNRHVFVEIRRQCWMERQRQFENASTLPEKISIDLRDRIRTAPADAFR